MYTDWSAEFPLRGQQEGAGMEGGGVQAQKGIQCPVPAKQLKSAARMPYPTRILGPGPLPPRSTVDLKHTAG
jgi:hypothetical protein